MVGAPSMEQAEFGVDAGAVQASGGSRRWRSTSFVGGAFHRVPALLAPVPPRAADVVYERYSLFLLAGAWLKRLTGVQLLREINAPLVRERT